MFKVKKVFARQVLDSRGMPTVEAEVHTQKGVFSYIVPTGTSAGKHEALELRDDDKAFARNGVKRAVSNVNSIIAPKMNGKRFSSQKEVDDFLFSLDGTNNKSKLGANAILSVSMSSARALAAQENLDLYEFIGRTFGVKKFVLPCAQSVMISGGAHADKSADFQEFMIMPIGSKNYSDSLQCIVEVYHELKGILKKKGMHTNVGKEGSYAPALKSNVEALDFLENAVKQAGYSVGKDVSFALDVAASEFYKNGEYVLSTESKTLSGGELIDYYSQMLSSYKLFSIEDAFSEDDFESFSLFTKKFGSKLQIVGDDLLVTNVERIKKAVSLKSCNALLLKLNQIGTVSESLDAAKLAMKSNWNVIVSHRSGDTEDTFIADLSVGLACGQIKPGAPARSERTAKYNQLLRIEEKLGSKAVFANLK